MINKSNTRPMMVFIALLTFLPIANCDTIKKTILGALGASEKYKPEGNSKQMVPVFNVNDATRNRIEIRLNEIAGGFEQPTDMQFPPGEDDFFLLAEKKGKLKWGRVGKKETGILLTLNVIYDVEEGLLGIAFHPDYNKNGKIYLNYTLKKGKKDFSRVSEWVLSKPKDIRNSKIDSERVIMEVEQPYSNHNAGQLVFGKDKMLYIGWGDGGWKDDPRKNGQNPKTFLGSMLRVDVDSPPDPGNAYKIPADNPFINDKCCAPETFAYGFRNPWRYTIDPKGRLVVADVGQDLWEEIDIVEKGKNYGWNIKEGSHCFEPKENCNSKNLSDPVYDYGREEGQSITGGYVYTSKEIPTLTGKYLFADFVTGRIWAFVLPDNASERVTNVFALGKWPVLISSFGRDDSGNVYVIDFGSGKIFRIEK